MPAPEPKVHEVGPPYSGKVRCGRPASSYRGDLPTTSDPEKVTCSHCRKLRAGNWGRTGGDNGGRRNFGEIHLPGSHSR